MRDLFAQYDRKIDRCRTALDAGADPALIATWIAEAQADRDKATAASRTNDPSPRHEPQRNVEELTDRIDEIGGLVAALREADPERKMDLYKAPETDTHIRPESTNGARHNRSWATPLAIGWCPRGDLNPHALYGH